MRQKNDRKLRDPQDELQPRPDTFDRAEEAYTAGFKLAEPLGSYHMYVQQCFVALAEVSFLADKLQDLKTVNLTIDECNRFATARRVKPGVQVANIVYESTVHGHPFRKLLRDHCVYETHGDDYMETYVSGWPSELTASGSVQRTMSPSEESLSAACTARQGKPVAQAHARRWFV